MKWRTLYPPSPSKVAGGGSLDVSPHWRLLSWSWLHGCIAVQSPETDEAFLCISKCLHLRCAWRWFCTETKDILGYLHHLILELGWELITKFDITSGFSQTDQRKALKAHVNNNMHTCIYRTYENKYQEFVQSAEAFRSSLYTPPRKVGTTANEVRYEVNNLMY